MSRLPASARDWIALLVVNAAIPVLVLWQLHETRIDYRSAIQACWVALAFVNAIFLAAAWQHGRRKGVRVPVALYPAALALALAAGFLTSALARGPRPRRSYLTLAASTVPLTRIHPARRRIVVRLLRERIAASRAYVVASAHEQPISPPLFSPASFASVSVIDSTIASLRQAWQIDRTYAARLHATDAEFRKAMATTDPRFLQSWTAAHARRAQIEARSSALEARWFQDVRALYRYAAAHHSQIAVQKNTLFFASAKTRAQFRSLAQASQQMQQQMTTLRQQLVQDHQKAALATGYE